MLNVEICENVGSCGTVDAFVRYGIQYVQAMRRKIDTDDSAEEFNYKFKTHLSLTGYCLTGVLY